MCPSTGPAYVNLAQITFHLILQGKACSHCNGLGYNKKVDIKKIFPDKNLSINRGGIAIIEGQNSKWIIKQIETIGKKFDFDLNTPIKKISDDGINAILYGINENFSQKLKKLE